MKHVTPEFKEELQKAVKVLVSEVRDSCIVKMQYGYLCNSCTKYLSSIRHNPRNYIKMPGGIRLQEIPKCSAPA